MFIFFGFRYLFGEEVNGMAYVVFGVMKDGQKKSLPASLQRVPVRTFRYFCGLHLFWSEMRSSSMSNVHVWLYYLMAILLVKGVFCVLLDQLGQWRQWSSHTEERTHHTDHPKYHGTGGKFHLCLCQRSHREWWGRSWFGLLDCLSLKINFADHHVSFVPYRKKGSKYLFIFGNGVLRCVPLFTFQAGKWWRPSWEVSRLSHHRTPSASRGHPNTTNLECPSMSR